MSRSGYSDDCDGWELIRWRGAVESAIRGKRGQAFLRELEAALVALPKKRLCYHDFASPDGEVCALGALAVKREIDDGASRAEALESVSTQFPEGMEAEDAGYKLGIAHALAAEITHMNDDCYGYENNTVEEQKQRYKRMLAWVRERIKA